MSGWALISLCCWNQDRFHWQNLDDTTDGIIKSPSQLPARRRSFWVWYDWKLPRERFHRADLAEIFRTHTLDCQTEPRRSSSCQISSTNCKATCKKSTRIHPHPMKNLRNPQRSTHHLFSCYHRHVGRGGGCFNMDCCRFPMDLREFLACGFALKPLLSTKKFQRPLRS